LCGLKAYICIEQKSRSSCQPQEKSKEATKPQRLAKPKQPAGSPAVKKKPGHKRGCYCTASEMLGSALSKKGYLDARLTLLLEDALAYEYNASSAIKQSVGGGKSIKEQRRKSLTQKVIKSKSPALILFQCLLEEEEVKAVFVSLLVKQDMSCLSIVLGLKKKKGVDEVLAMAREAAAAKAKQPPQFVSSSTPTRDESRVGSEEVEEQHNALEVELFGSLKVANEPGMLEDASTLQDRLRIKLDHDRQNYLEELLLLRENEAQEEKECALLDQLRSFCDNQLDGNRLRFEYWLQRCNLAQHEKDASLHGEVLAERGRFHTKRAELQQLFKKKGYNALQRVKESILRAEAEREELVKETLAFSEEFLTNKVPHNIHFQQSLEERKELPCFVDSEELIQEFIQKRNTIVQDLAEKLKSERAQIMQTLLSKKEEERAVKEGTSEGQQRDDDQMPSVEEKNGGISGAPSSPFDDSLKAKLEAQRLEQLSSLFSTGCKAFHSSFLDSVSRSAQLALKSIDKRFIVEDQVTTQSRPLLADVFWNIEQREWEGEVVEEHRKTICRELVNDLEARLLSTREKIVASQLARLEKMQEFAKKTQKRPGSGQVNLS